MSDPQKSPARLNTFAKDPVFLLSKLAWEIDEIGQPRNAGLGPRIFTSLNAASTAWHIHEWLWKTASEDDRARISEAFNLTKQTAVEFGLACQKASRSVRICRQIAVAGKHYTLKHHDDNIFPETYARDDNLQDCYVVIRHYGEANEDVDVYKAALAWWIKIYLQLGYESAAEVTELVSALVSDNTDFHH